MTKIIKGKGIGNLVILAAVLAVLYSGAAATNSPASGGIFNLIVLVIFGLVALLYFRRNGSSEAKHY